MQDSQLTHQHIKVSLEKIVKKQILFSHSNLHDLKIIDIDQIVLFLVD